MGLLILTGLNGCAVYGTTAGFFCIYINYIYTGQDASDTGFVRWYIVTVEGVIICGFGCSEMIC